MLLARVILLLTGAYALVGLLVAIAFAARGVDRVDAGARSAPAGFRLLIIPGAAALWPVVLRWWARADARGASPSHGPRVNP